MTAAIHQPYFTVAEALTNSLDLFDEPDIHRRVAAVLTYLDDHARAEPL